VGSGTTVIGMVGSGSATLSTSYRQGICPMCMVPNVHGARCVINRIDTKAQFPALSPGHCTLTYGDVLCEHVDFYGSVHTHTVSWYVDGCNMPCKYFCGMFCCIAVCRRTSFENRNNTTVFDNLYHRQTDMMRKPIADTSCSIVTI